MVWCLVVFGDLGLLGALGPLVSWGLNFDGLLLLLLLLVVVVVVVVVIVVNAHSWAIPVGFAFLGLLCLLCECSFVCVLSFVLLLCLCAFPVLSLFLFLPIVH